MTGIPAFFSKAAHVLTKGVLLLDDGTPGLARWHVDTGPFRGWPEFRLAQVAASLPFLLYFSRELCFIGTKVPWLNGNWPLVCSLSVTSCYLLLSQPNTPISALLMPSFSEECILVPRCKPGIRSVLSVGGTMAGGSEGPGAGCVPGELTHLRPLPPQAGEVLSLEQLHAYGRNLSRECLVLKQQTSALATTPQGVKILALELDDGGLS